VSFPPAAQAVPAAPASRKVRPAFIAQAALIGSAIAIYLLVLGAAGLRHQDLEAYLAAARDIWHGAPLYATFLHHPFPDPTLRPAFIYPPAFALLIAPLGLLPDAVASAIWLLIGQASLIGALALIVRWQKPPSWAVTALILATLTFYPLWIDVLQGQANLPVLLLVTAGVAGVARGRPRYGAALGIAAALKLTPLVLLVWLLLDRRLRAAGWMLGAFATVCGLGALFRFNDTVVFFGQVLPALAPGTAFYANQSLSGALDRVSSANPYTQPWIDVPWAFLLPSSGVGPRRRLFAADPTAVVGHLAAPSRHPPAGDLGECDRPRRTRLAGHPHHCAGRRAGRLQRALPLSGRAGLWPGGFPQCADP